MAISIPEFARRYAAIRAGMEHNGLDCLLVYGLADDFNRGNIRYITGYGRGGCCVFPREGDPIFLMPPNQSKSPKLPKIMAARELLHLRETPDPTGQVVKELARFDRGNRVGIVGLNCIPVPVYLAVNERFPGRVTDAAGIFEKLRVVKSEEEIALLRKSAAIADDVFTMLMKTIRADMSDYDIYGKVKSTIFAAGCDYSFDLIDASGSHLNMTFWPTGEKLKANSTLFLEITPAYGGYYAQLPVTLPVVSYPPEIKKMVSVWEQANREALKILRPGTKVSDLFHALINTVKDSGYISPLRPGHAIGLDALDFWSITPDNEVILEPGMVLAVHPCIMTKLWEEGCGLGYTYLITETGAERFSQVELALLK
ncbi:MAG TPA: Xaa-Pro peptidase family protein [Dehalococcoidales bacterium]|nr:Xaa-Pro peptidase family protein [Dehalococcoidales bacterium]